MILHLYQLLFLTFNRDSAATRVNEKGLIEDVGYFGPELVQNGDFSEIGPELVTNGDFSVSGVVNTSSYTLGWYSPDSNINITNNELVITNGASIGGRAYATDGVNSINVVISGKFYKLVYTITENNDNATMFYHTGGAYVSAPNTVGTHTIYYKAAGTIFILRNNTTNTTVKIDNVSVKEVGQNWTFGTGWSMGDGVAICDGSQTSNSSLQQSSVAEVGKVYKIVFDLTVTSGQITYVNLGGWIDNTNLNSSGTYVYTTTTTTATDNFGIAADSNFIGSIDNVSVIEVLGDKPRIDYSDSLTEPSLLLEPQSTNTATYSNDFTQGDVFNGSSDPSLNSSVLTSEQGVAPDGTNTAQKLTDNNDGGTGTIGLSYFSVNLTSGQQSTVSIFVKKDTLRYFVISFANFDTNQEISFDLNTNIINRGSGVITEYSNGWYRCSATFSTTTDTVGAIGFYGTDLANVVGGNLRDGTKSVLIWGLQCEELPYATSYIPTTGATATRLGETVNNAGDVNVFNSEEGVLYAEIAALADNETNREITLSDGTTNNYVLIRFNSGGSNRIYTRVDVNTSVEYFELNTSYNITDNNKIAIRFKNSDFATFINGTKVDFQLSGNTFPSNTLNKINFDNGGGTNKFHGKVKNVKVFNKALTDKELEILTIQ
jgi:hypothetical protein